MRGTLNFNLPEEQKSFLHAIKGVNYYNAICDLLNTLKNINEDDKLQYEHDLGILQVKSIQDLIYEALRMNDITIDVDE